MMQNLFRSEVIERRHRSSMGEIVLLPDVKLSTVIYCLSTFLAVILVYLFAAQFPLTQQVPGLVLPDKGIIKVYPPDGGTYREIFVREGQKVKAGDKLALVNFEAVVASGSDIQQLQADSLREMETNLQNLVNRHPTESEIDKESLFNQKQKLEREQELLIGQKNITQQRIDLFQKRVTDLQELYFKKLISRQIYDEATDQYLRLRQEASEQAGDLNDIQSELRSLSFRIEKSDYEASENLSQLKKKLSDVVIQRSANDLTRERLLRAPVNGTVTALQNLVGQFAKKDKPLLMLLPENSLFVAELYVPSRAIGKIQINQKVNLQYEAFPFQEYGTFRGRVAQTSPVAIHPSEVQNIHLGEGHEPVYLVTVELDHQTVKANRFQHPLQSGMPLQASIILEKRRLWQWIIEPFNRNKSL